MIWTIVIGIIISLLLAAWGSFLIWRRNKKDLKATKTKKKYYDLFIEKFPYILILCAVIVIISLIIIVIGDIKK